MSRWAVGVAALLMAAGAPVAAAEPPPVGQVVTVAGIGEEGYSGDGHRATDARISNRGGISVGPDGTLYLADYWSGRVRTVNGDRSRHSDRGRRRRRRVRRGG